MNKIILLSLFAIVGVLGLGQIAFAESTMLSVLPTTINKTVGTPFDISARINPAGNNVCAVRGTIDFKGLSCQNITVASGLMAAIAPTCASPSFLIGIPKCTTNIQNIFSMSVKGTRAGIINLAFTSVRIMGAGIGDSSVWQGGAYNITTSVKPSSVVVQTPTSQVKQATSTEPTVAAGAVNPAEQTILDNNIPTGVGAAALSRSGTKWYNYLLIALIVIVVGYGIYYIVSKRKKK